MKFAEKVKELRTRNGLSQQQLADAIGVSRRTIINYESGTYPRNRNQFKRLAEVLETNEDYLLTESEQFEAEAYMRYGARGKKQAQALTEELASLFAAGGELEEEDMKAMIDALQEAFWIAKLENRKYGRRKVKPEESEKPEGLGN